MNANVTEVVKQPNGLGVIVRNALAVVALGLCLFMAVVAVAFGSGLALLLYLLAAALALGLTSWGRSVRRAKTAVPGWVLLIGMLMLVLTGAGMQLAQAGAVAIEKAEASEARFARDGEARLARAERAVAAGDSATASAALDPIRHAKDPRIGPLSLASEQLVATPDKAKAVEALLARAVRAADPEPFIAAADAIDASLSESLLPKAEAALAAERQAAEVARKTEEQDRKIKALLNGYDGSALHVKRAVRERLNNPASFEHVETRARRGPSEDTAIVSMTFRATNGFGAIVTQEARALVDMEGKVISLDLPRP